MRLSLIQTMIFQATLVDVKDAASHFAPLGSDKDVVAKTAGARLTVTETEMQLIAPLSGSTAKAAE